MGYSCIHCGNDSRGRYGRGGIFCTKCGKHKRKGEVMEKCGELHRLGYGSDEYTDSMVEDFINMGHDSVKSLIHDASGVVFSESVGV